MERPTAYAGFPLLSLLGLLFIGLKLAGVIAWSWWWVLAPFWGGFLVAIVFFVVILLIYAHNAR